MMAKTYRKEIKVSGRFASDVNFYLSHEPESEDDAYLHEDDIIRETAVFDDGKEMDIKCCGVRYEEGSVNTAWTEAVLFDGNRGEIACSEVGEEFLGTWKLHDKEGNAYIVDVTVADEKETYER